MSKRRLAALQGIPRRPCTIATVMGSYVQKFSAKERLLRGQCPSLIDTHNMFLPQMDDEDSVPEHIMLMVGFSLALGTKDERLYKLVAQIMSERPGNKDPQKTDKA
jgi:hypothetical protein